ncbi:MAG: WD40/YVTN/BNR-like repeat-containing protein [Candidatus Heimdallarchaeota archaeon]
MLIAAKTGHLGPTIFISDNKGRTWTEAKKPPAFNNNNRTVNFVFWITPGHSSEPEVWYAGTSPQGLFKTVDGGFTWDEGEGFADNELIKEIVNNNEGTPIGPLLHSININPKDRNHICEFMSTIF